MSSLDNLFNPKSVALIGASTKEYSIGNVIIKNLLHYNYNGPIYPINTKGEDIRGLKAYTSILDIPGDVELAHIVIPPSFVPDAVEDCGKKGVKSIIINTAGFKEMGEDGLNLENDFLARAKKYGIRVFGPNCQGIINSDPDIRAYCNFTFTYFNPGSISIVAQSGGVGAIIMQAFHDMGIGMRMYASNGNGSDISIPEIISYYGKDEKTKVIVVYIESLADSAEFMKVAKEVAAIKPILAIYAGKTDKGAEASKSHTGGLAGGITMELIFKKTGILSFPNLEELCYAASVFASQPIPKGNKVGMITNTGGPGIVATDELVSCGLEIPQISDQARAKLKETMLEAASINNPLDVVATAGAVHFKSALEVMINESHIDSIYLIFVTPPFVDCESVAKVIADISREQKKPIVCNYITDKQTYINTSKLLKEGGVPCFDFPETAAKALSALVRYNNIISQKKGNVKIYNDVDKEKVTTIFNNLRKQNVEVLTALNVYEILEAYKIPVASWGIAKDAESASEISERIGFPVVIKADSSNIIHKSDLGGVALNIKNKEEVVEVISIMNRKFNSSDLKFFIQKFIPHEREFIIGAKAETGLGHLIMFGIGGVFVEVYKDVSFNIAPITDEESKEMLDFIKASPLLNGYRGSQKINKIDITEVLQRISKLVIDFHFFIELDIYQLIAFGDSICAVDGRIII